MENTIKELAKELNDLLDDAQITLDNIDDIARIINALQCSASLLKYELQKNQK